MNEQLYLISVELITVLHRGPLIISLINKNLNATRMEINNDEKTRLRLNGENTNT